jgi:1-aminocyclopropane-1-carboxylate deaminase
MELIFVSREEYRKKEFNIKDEYYLLPEGGTNELAVKGCAEISSLIDIPFDYISCAIGTGGTIAGIISSLKENQKAIGFPVLKGGEFLKNEIEKLVPSKTNFELQTEYHFGGYAKKNEELLNFISDFKLNHNIVLDFVYTGKMMFGIFDLIKKNYFEKGATIVAVHTGGLFQFTDSQPRH